MKKRTATPIVPTEAAKDTAPEMKPSDELQIYYNDAYMREKQRLNNIFGVIEEDKPVVETVEVEPDMSDYVHIGKYKKMKRRAGALGFFMVVFAIAAVALAVIHFVL